MVPFSPAAFLHHSCLFLMILLITISDPKISTEEAASRNRNITKLIKSSQIFWSCIIKEDVYRFAYLESKVHIIHVVAVEWWMSFQIWVELDPKVCGFLNTWSRLSRLRLRTLLNQKPVRKNIIWLSDLSYRNTSSRWLNAAVASPWVEPESGRTIKTC